ncbi:MAG: dynamin family protein, partial [Jiangellaceae bacterium]
MVTSEVSVGDALGALRDRLDDIRLPLDAAGAEAARQVRRESMAQLDDYVLPRLRQLDAPLLAVVGGSTGAGKSTLVNALVGRSVTATGVLRPTTRSPVLVHHPDDAGWFADRRILPDLARVTGGVDGGLHLVPDAGVPAGLALLDAPDIDSVVGENRALAGQLLAAADLWLFVTSAARYADAVPWDFLNAAAARSAAIAVVLDRVTPDAVDEVRTHLAGMLAGHGLGDAPLFVVGESTLDESGQLPATAVSDVRNWLHTLAADDEARDAVVRRTLDGAIGGLVRQAPVV